MVIYCLSVLIHLFPVCQALFPFSPLYTMIDPVWIDIYHIPYRCLYSKDIDNLFVSSRCISCSHVGLGGPRVMHTTGQMGVAVGYAAALCRKYNTNPRGVYRNHIAELKEMIRGRRP